MSFRYSLFLATLCYFSLFAVEKNKTLSFDSISKLNPEEMTRQELTKRFGKPDETLDFAKLPNSKLKGEEWTYKQNGEDRLTFSFEEGSNVANSWFWNVYKGEPEKNLKAAKKKFQGAQWEAQTEKWINPHYFPSECFYRDEKQGISLTYNLVRKEVSSISRWNPMRKIASETNEKPPEYCLGNSCIPAYAAKEFFKDRSVSEYCEKYH